MSYVPINIDLSKAQQKKLISGKSVRVTKEQINKGPTVYLHPLNAKKVNSAKNGVTLSLSKGEISYTAKHNGIVSGGSIWDSIWSGIKSIGSFLKTSGIGSEIANTVQTLATPFVGPAIANLGREALRATTGVGLTSKQKKVDNMNRARSMKKGMISVIPANISGSSFRIN